jgi:hypothetical protein
MSSSIVLSSTVTQAIDAYRTCELVTIGKDGTPVAWPTSCLSRADGTILVTTSLAFPQKAYNIRREPRLALLFSDPTGSGLADPEQILVTGRATCPDVIHTEPDQDLGTFWARMFLRQPACRKYLDWPTTLMTDFYFMRLLITVTPEQVTHRPLPATANDVPASGQVGAGVLSAYRTVVLCALDSTGSPLLVRTTVTGTSAGYGVTVPDDLPVAPGPASLLVHRHDEQLWDLHNANIRGDLIRTDDGWTLFPHRLIEPATGLRPGPADQLRLLRTCRATTRGYLRRRGLSRPRVPWPAYRAIRAAVTSGQSTG